MKVGIGDIETSSLNADGGILLCCCIKPYDCYITGRKTKITTLRADSYKTWKTNKTNQKEFIQDVLNAVGKETDEVTCTGCKTAGFFVGNKAGSFKIALSISEDENYGDVLAIPTKQILAIYKLMVNNNG